MSITKKPAIMRHRILFNPVSIFFLFSVFVFVSGSSVSAQGRYTAWQHDETLANRQAEIFGGFTAILESDRQGVDKFFDTFYFSRWTVPTEQGKVHGYAKDMIEKDFKDMTGSARTYLLNKSFDTLRKMAADASVPPTARYNAMLAIGQLNQTEASARNAKPVPYSQSLEYLVKEYRNTKNPDYVRLGAMIGIHRHVLVDVADATMKDETLPTLFVNIVREGKPIANRKAEEQELIDWFRIRAIDGLGALKAAGIGGNSAIVDLLVELIENVQESNDIRVRAARALGELDFQAHIGGGGAAINFQRLGSQLITLCKQICDSEISALNDLRAQEMAAQGGGAALGGRNPSPLGGGIGGAGTGAGSGAALNLANDPKQVAEVKKSMQRIKTAYGDILYGIRGTRWAGQTTVGVLPMITPSDDVVVSKLNLTTRAMSQLFKILDDGRPEDPNAPATGALAGGGTVGGPGGSGGAATVPAEKLPKVNLTILREELEVFSATMDSIITGGGT